MKQCTKCLENKEDNLFNKKTSSKDGLSSQCRECNKLNLKNHYNTNRKYYIDRNSKRRVRIIDLINSRKTKCSQCAENHIGCLDFHHLRDKKINIAELVNSQWSLARVEEELNKCIVLCSNCHRKLHWEERNILP